MPVLLLVLSAMAAQEDTFTSDIHGRRTGLPISLNGRRVETEKIEEKILEETPTRKVIERYIWTAAPDGGKGQPVKIVIEENKGADGSVTRDQKTYRGDLNGRLNLYEQLVSESKPAGAGVVDTTTTISRGSINGGVEVQEKRTGTATTSGNTTQEQIHTYRKDANGTFREAARVLIEREKQGENRTIEKVTEYQNATVDGTLQLSSQRVSTEDKSPSGRSTKQVDIYGMAQAGRVSTPGELKLREQQIIEQEVAGGQTRETFSIRRPNLEGRLPENFTKISERVCQGKCQN